MSEKRRDHRGRILHNGEIQLSDGRYRFKYVDEMGKERCVYSWRLDHNDATPKGKRRTLSLREMEKKIHADHFEQIATNGGNMTILELYINKNRCQTYYSCRIRNSYQFIEERFIWKKKD